MVNRYVTRNILVAISLVSVILTSCSSEPDVVNSQTLISLPSAPVTTSNKNACLRYLQPKNPAPAGSAMSTTISFYRDLSSISSGSLAEAFQLVAARTTEIAPYYEADRMPPDDVMARFQAAINVVEQLCYDLINSSSTTPSDQSDGNSLPKQNSLEALRELYKTLCETIGNTCNSPLLDDDPTNDGGSADFEENYISTTSIPFATERNEYWNANCPRVLRPNELLPLLKCDKGEGVRRVQMILGVESDGLFGNDTFNALLLFQQANNLPMTGEVDLNTWRLLDPTQSGPGSDYNGDGLVTPDEFDR